ncbi:nickel ABC transporter substrate-binding protein [Geomicrobium sp. JCM 19038]|uniref:nickel ABC transporter substrate-binding protein n=1 Tax=Geomicrobium sp. JCM 19038 TaxID=1460635 RepID=UPI00045F449F|nr:nickel ABC transporter substrate-binding protein [Geomicrobium sp. JCM 19038]GAK07789.1 nickel ABC transporter, periplasmic nickel-binding protein NikA [Geomicrobium sp. JCM 19038]
MIKRTYLFTAMLLFVLIAACSSGNVKSESNELVIAWPQDIGAMDPRGYGASQMFAQNLIFESLVQYNAEGEIEPLLAEDWQQSEDGKTTTFYLREDVQFSDGSPFNADDVKANFDKVLDNRERHAWLELANQLQEVNVIDEYTVELTLSEAYYPLFEELALVRPFRIAKEVDGQYVGTGIYELEQHDRDERAVFSGNEHYWSNSPNVDRLVVQVIPDSESRMMALDNGEIDLVYGNGLLSMDAIQYFEDQEGFTINQSNPQATRTAVLNTNRGPLEELSVRQAFIHSFNTNQVVEDVFYGTEEPATALFGDHVPYMPPVDPYDFDSNRAEQLLEEAGWNLGEDDFRVKDGKPLSLSYVYDANDAIQRTIGEWLQQGATQVGISVQLEGVDNQAYLNAQKSGEFDVIYQETWGAPYDPHAFVSSMRIPAHADYQAQLGLEKKAKIDEMIDQVFIATEESKRIDLYDEILQEIHDQAVYLPISYTSTIAVHHEGISGVEFAPIPYEFQLEKVQKNAPDA